MLARLLRVLLMVVLTAMAGIGLASAGEFETLLRGRIIDASDGNLWAKLRLKEDSVASADIGRSEHLSGIWWARPDGQVCVAFKAFWEGGDCGFVRRSGKGYSLTLGAWTPPAAFKDSRVAVQTNFPAPASAPGKMNFTRKDLVGKTLKIRDSFSELSYAFKEDGTFDYKADTGLAFRAHWWIKGKDLLCVVSRTLWRTGRCYELRFISFGQEGYLVPLAPDGIRYSDAWFPARLEGEGEGPGM